MRDQAEDRAAQLEADHALVRMQLDEKDAEERLAKVRVVLLWCGTATEGDTIPRTARVSCATRSPRSRRASHSSWLLPTLRDPSVRPSHQHL